MVRNVTQEVKNEQLVNFLQTIPGTFIPAPGIIHVKTKEDLPETAGINVFGYVDKDDALYTYAGGDIGWILIEPKVIPLEEYNKKENKSLDILNRVFND